MGVRVEDRTHLDSIPVRYLSAAAIVIFSAIFFAKALQLHGSFATAAYDLGIFGQNLALLDDPLNAFNTVRGLSTFGDHFQPILFIFFPFYKLYPTIHWLLFFQVLTVAAAAWVLARLVQRLCPGNAILASTLVISFLANPVVHNPLLWHFHPITIALPLLFLWLEAYLSGNNIRYYLLLILLYFVREDIVFTTLAFCIVPLWQGRFRLALVTAVASLAWWFLVTQLAMPFFNGEGYFRDSNHTLSRVLANALDPSYYYERLWQTGDARVYLAYIFLPMLCLPLLSPLWLIPAIPTLGVIVLMGQYQTQIIYHYSVYVVPFLYLALLTSISRYRRTAIDGTLGILFVIASFTSAYYGSALSPAAIGADIDRWRELAPMRADIAKLDREIGHDRGISASDFLLPHFTDRRSIYLFPNPWKVHYWGIRGEKPHHPNMVDYLVLDPSLALKHYDLLRYLTDNHYFKFTARQERYWVLKRLRPEPPGRPELNPGASSVILDSEGHLRLGSTRLSPLFADSAGGRNYPVDKPDDTAPDWRRGDYLKNGLLLLDFSDLTPGVAFGTRIIYQEILASEPASLVLLTGSDDTLDVWLNGDHLYSQGQPRMARPASDRLLLKLRAGANHLYLQVSNLGGAWRLLAEFLPESSVGPETPEVVENKVTGRNDQGDEK